MPEPISPSFVAFPRSPCSPGLGQPVRSILRNEPGQFFQDRSPFARAGDGVIRTDLGLEFNVKAEDVAFRLPSLLDR